MEEEEEKEDPDFNPVEFRVPRTPPPSRYDSGEEEDRRVPSIVPSVVHYKEIEDMETARHAVYDPKWYYGKHKRPIHIRDKLPPVVKTANNSDVEISDSSDSWDTDLTEPYNSPEEGTPDHKPVVLGAAKQIDTIKQNTRYYYSQSVRRRREHLHMETTSDEDSDTESIFDEAKVIMNDKTKDTQSKWLEINKKINQRYANDEVTKWRIVMRMREMMTHKFTTTFRRWWDDEIERKRRLQELGNKKPTLAENICLQRKVQLFPGSPNDCIKNKLLVVILRGHRGTW